MLYKLHLLVLATKMTWVHDTQGPEEEKVLKYEVNYSGVNL